MSVTIQELAQLANTSVATISRVLNNKPGVSDARRKSILQLASKLGYQPNQFARNLVMQKSHTLGVITSNLGNPDYVQFLKLFTEGMRPDGYRMLVADSSMDLARERENVDTMLQHMAEGLFIFPIVDFRMNSDISHLLELQHRRVPFVLLGLVEHYNFDCVTSEEEQSGERLAQHLLDLGHTRLGLLGWDSNNRCVVQRTRGVANALRAAGLDSELGDDPGTLARMAGGPHRELLARTFEWLEQPKPPTALISINDSIAAGLLKPLAAKGISVPGTVSVVAFGEHGWSGALTPSLTTCGPNMAEVARLAVETLKRRMENPDAPPVQHLVPQRITLRESSGPVPQHS